MIFTTVLNAQPFCLHQSVLHREQNNGNHNWDVTHTRYFIHIRRLYIHAHIFIYTHVLLLLLLLCLVHQFLGNTDRLIPGRPDGTRCANNTYNNNNNNNNAFLKNV